MSSKIINYFVSGMLSEERELFVRRIAEILAKTQYAELLADGVPVAAICQDEDKCMAMLGAYAPNGAYDIKVLETMITEDFMVYIEYSYLYPDKNGIERESISDITASTKDASKYGIRVEYV